MRVLILKDAEPSTFKKPATGDEQKEAIGVKFQFGDRAENCAFCFVEVNQEKNEEKEAIAKFKAGAEVVIRYGKMILDGEHFLLN